MVHTIARLIAILACLTPIAAAASSTITVCNQGDVALETAMVDYRHSILYGTGYDVEGWYHVEPDKCEDINTSSDVYLGFAYRDAGNVLRTHLAHPGGSMREVGGAAQRFCVATGGNFQYTTQQVNGASCPAGYKPLVFSLFIDGSGMWSRLANAGHLTYTVKPRRDEGGQRLAGVSEVAELLTGVPVQRAGRAWKERDGKPVSDNLINSKTKTPPLAPRVQFPPSREPVAGLLRQIRSVVNGIVSCAHLGVTFQQKSIDLNDRGVVRSAYTGAYDQIDLMVLADMNLSQPSLRRIEERQGQCWQLEIACKSGGYCGQHWTKEWVSASSVVDILTNTREQATTILDALKRIAPSYPDATPEIRKLE